MNGLGLGLGAAASALAVLLAVVVVVLVVLMLRQREQLASVSSRLKEYSSLDDAKAAERQALDAATDAFQRKEQHERDLAAAQQRLTVIKAQIDEVQETVNLQSFGVYEPKYGFSTSEEYKASLDETRAGLKRMVKGGVAALCPREWTVDGSRAEGRKMTNRQIKLMLRAFNGESDAAIAKVTYSNAENMLKRIQRSFEAINKLGEPVETSIQRDYLDLKKRELRLWHEFRVKKHEEKEAAREAARKLREEERAAKEIAKIEKEAEKDEARTAKALEKARAELAKLHGATLEKQQEHATRLEEAVARLEGELQAAIDRKAKAISRAQLTRSGWVYVLSNVGSFGEGVYKIGLTRRFDPMVRVKELGDASVPFLFDVHCMVFAEDAPALETALHRKFDAQRVNLVNRRKEYFRVGLDQIRQAVAEEHGIVSFVLEPDAAEFYESEALRRSADGLSAS